MFSIKDVLEKLTNKINLSEVEAKRLLLETLSGNLKETQIAAWLIALQSKGVQPLELYSFVLAIRELSHSSSLSIDLLDTCGTGGDSANIINISTLSALVLSSLGVSVAKHGNRAVSSSVGSADILESLGYSLNENPEKTYKRILEENFGFLFAPHYHSVMKQVAHIRKDLEIRTVFNLIGPLSNPLQANIQIIGVFSPDLLDLVVQTLSKLKIDYALVVHSNDGLDEISPVAITQYRLLIKGIISKGEIKPPQNISIKKLSEIKVYDKDDALQKAKDILSGNFLAGIEAVAINAVAAHYLWNLKKATTNLTLQEYIDTNISVIINHILQGKVFDIIQKWNH